MRIALGISYQGGAYYGWQSQAKLPCIQTYLEQAVSQVADHPVALQCAGRTDKGLLGSNSYLPADIRVNWVHEVESTFHARFSALARRYSYIIYNRRLKSALWNTYVSHCDYPLNENDMQLAAHYFLGEHDFSSFRAASCQANHARREIQHIRVKRQGDYVSIDIQANAFLHHMVRNISAVLMLIGGGQKPTLWAQEVLLARNRKKADVTASPTGLYLYQVIYPENFALPQLANDFFNFPLIS